VWLQHQGKYLHLQWLKECDDFHIVKFDSIVKRGDFGFDSQIPVYIPDETTICSEGIPAVQQVIALFDSVEWFIKNCVQG
jgi:hypothetical protein